MSAALDYIAKRRGELARAERAQTDNEDHDLPSIAAGIVDRDERNALRLAYIQSAVERRKVIRDEYMALSRREQMERRRLEGEL